MCRHFKGSHVVEALDPSQALNKIKSKRKERKDGRREGREFKNKKEHIFPTMCFVCWVRVEENGK